MYLNEILLTCCLLQGCNYDRGATNACNRGGYAYGYRDPQAEFRTILSPYCVAGQCTGNPLPVGAACTRILRFSIPYGMYNDKPYGDAGSDCVQRINFIGESVSSFFTRPPPTPPPTSRPTNCLGIGQRLSNHIMMYSVQRSMLQWMVLYECTRDFCVSCK